MTCIQGTEEYITSIASRFNSGNVGQIDQWTKYWLGGKVENKDCAALGYPSRMADKDQCFQGTSIWQVVENSTAYVERTYEVVMNLMDYTIDHGNVADDDGWARFREWVGCDNGTHVGKTPINLWRPRSWE